MKVLGYKLDKYQEKIIKENNKNLLVIAGAGSGKSLTIIGKIKYLVEKENIKEDEIIAITFTNNARLSLKEKLNKESLSKVESYTFHKLAISILNNNYQIASDNTLIDIVHYFFYIKVLDYEEFMYLILKYFNKRYLFNIKKEYIKFIYDNKDKIKSLEKLIITFIHQYKCNNYKLEDYKYLLRKIKSINYFKYKKEKLLLILIINIYIEYTNYLKENNELDFDDLIINATNKVKEKYSRKIKYIIIDEYQDISYIRLLLVKEIINKTNAKIMVVGDDYQSIYKFSGCDISLFWDFKNYFKNTKIIYLKNTYRNSIELVNISVKFIMKNKMQLKKEIYSNKRLNNPVQIIYYTDIRKEIKKLFNRLSGNILILGRNNNDKYMIEDNDIKIKDDKVVYKDLNIKYMTIHKSKGLEEDNVIVINLIDNILGLPNQIKNYKILRIITNNKDNYLYSEERRLFYVALTRTKNYVYLLVPNKNESIFINEIKNILM